MSAPGSLRRLTAVVFTDIVGYSAIVHRDEALGARLLDRQREVVRRFVPQHRGREVETAGDSFLLEFDSALAAVEAVIAIQQELARQNDSQPDGEKVLLRASVHLGDVEHRGEEIYGDGVNTAARLLPHSPPGGMAVSSQVLGMVRQRIQLPVKSIGSPELKNIATPVEIFTVEAEALLGLVQDAPAPAAGKQSGPVFRRRWVVPAALAVAAAVLAAAFLTLRPRPAEALDKSVAVLPFTNMSANADHAWFADGMQDEILTHLARIRDIKVISRTSVEKYRSQKHDLRTIARELDVATVVEGAVQRVGERVRINVQLIDANTDAHLWAESYDRDLADVFAVQSEIARKVADSLKATLLPKEAQAIAAVPTQNQKAYELFLQANALALQADNSPWDSSVTPARQAAALYEQALAADPDFALAAAGLSFMHMQIHFLANDGSETRLAAARAAAERALALQPNLGEAHLAMGAYHYYGHRDYNAAQAEFNRALGFLPNDVSAVGFTGNVLRRQGRLDEALAYHQRVAELNPQSADAWRTVGETYSMLRRFAESETAWNRAVAVSADPAIERALAGSWRVTWTGDLAPLRAALAGLKPDQNTSRYFYDLYRWERDDAAMLKLLEQVPEVWLPYIHGGGPQPKVHLVAQALRRQGETARAREAYQQAETLLRAAQPEREQDPNLHALLAYVHAGLGRKAEAIAAARMAVELLPVSKDALFGPAYLGVLAEIYAATGEHDQALELLRQLLVMPGGLTPAILKLDPAWDPLRGDARFEALLKQQSLPEA